MLEGKHYSLALGAKGVGRRSEFSIFIELCPLCFTEASEKEDKEKDVDETPVSKEKESRKEEDKKEEGTQEGKEKEGIEKLLASGDTLVIFPEAVSDHEETENQEGEPQPVGLLILYLVQTLLLNEKRGKKETHACTQAGMYAFTHTHTHTRTHTHTHAGMPTHA